MEGVKRIQAGAYWVVDTATGARVETDDERLIALVHSHEPKIAAKPARMGVPAQPEVPKREKPRDKWTFEFPGRHLTEAEIRGVLDVIGK
jgi:hypothetical protein